MSPSSELDREPSEHPGLGACFFLSYAHITPRFPTSRGPDYWVREFFRDLCNELVSLDPRWYTEGQPGFMDHSMPGGAMWPRRLAEQLAGCRVFVPLYSRAYFISEFCGKEWAVFRERQMAHIAETGMPNEAVIPVLWQPIRHDELPAHAGAVQVAPLGDSPLYQDRGLFELIRLHRETEYLRVVIRLAELLNDAARKAPPPGPVADLDTVTPLFPQRPDVAPKGRRLYLTVVAHDKHSAPPGRHRHFYGDQPEDWNPYHPETTVPLLSRAEDVARELGYTPTRHPDTGAETPDGPGIVLVDPWMVEDAAGAERIREADGKLPPWVRALIPWGRHDTQTAERVSVLRAKLKHTMPRMEARRVDRPTAPELGTIAQFGHNFSGEVDLAWRSYHRSASPEQPPGGYPALRRLDAGPAAQPGADPGSQPSDEQNP